MKIAPFIKAIRHYNDSLSPEDKAVKTVNHILVHTGQHYDRNMSDNFFEELGIPEPDINLGVGSGSHAEQVGQTMIELEKVLLEARPDWVVLVGDVNATLAASVTAKKLWIRVAHIEAGLRSGDMTMPEEINRLVTDRLADLLLTPDRISGENLRAEGVPEKKIRFVGNIMIDTLEANREKAAKLDPSEIIRRNLIEPVSGLRSAVCGAGFSVLTLRRPSNVDSREVLEPIVRFLIDEVEKEMDLVWPIHPRTKKQLETFGLWEEVISSERTFLLEPIGYLDMLRLNMDARVMLTDSGGLQEECTILGTPCLTMRWNTERPITLREYGGASILVGNNIEKIRAAYEETIKRKRIPVRPELWDGHTAERCLEEFLRFKD
jgi:UDP-N-acetylglucosamine 2-epimerase (non-hydrolysing)